MTDNQHVPFYKRLVDQIKRSSLDQIDRLMTEIVPALSLGNFSSRSVSLIRVSISSRYNSAIETFIAKTVIRIIHATKETNKSCCIVDTQITLSLFFDKSTPDLLIHSIS